ncbi:MAG: hypothetical protein HYZ25_06960 [Chloroflexi bacterium]|nr:hypothetical protein [Chloroflexota bacterium]
MLDRLKHSRWTEVILLVLVNVLVYLPSVLRLGYYRDEWYFLYDGVIGGRGIFWDMFLSDRPVRGLFFEALFSLTHFNPLTNHLLTLLWRVLGSLCVYWLVQLIWPAQRRAAWIAAALFGTFPGFLWWVAGIEYQPIVLSASLMVFSFALTVKAFPSQTLASRMAFTAGAILTGWLYVALVEYATGMELFRLALIFVLVAQREVSSTFWTKVRETLRVWWINVIIPAGFLFWRIFIFNNERKATDLGEQVGNLFGDPLHVGADWLLNFVRSALNVTVAAWVAPFQQNFYGNTLKEMVIAVVVAAGVLILFWVANQTSAGREAQSTAETNWRAEMTLLGLVGLCAGILPVVVVNRYIVFDAYSHYSLPASLGGVLLVTTFASWINSERARMVFLSLMLALTALSQVGLGSKALAEEQKINEFWWQFSWRVPALKAGTMLAVNYPQIEYTEDYETVSGPADLIYFPTPTNASPVVYPVTAMSLTNNDLLDTYVGRLSVERTIRSHTFVIDYGNALVISQPDPSTCVHVLDARWPDLSATDKDAFILLAQNSKIENVVTDASFAEVPTSVFGAEPTHDWCYYYQKADLARQVGDWQSIIDLNKEVAKLGLHPNDQIEWMPFLQAAAVQGDEKQVKQISTRINSVAFYKMQACQTLRAMGGYGYPLAPGMDDVVSGLFCGGKP